MAEANAPTRMNIAGTGAPSGMPLRQRLFLGLATVIFIAAAGYGLYWFFIASNYVSTDDAYVGASLADITPRVDGTIDAVPVADTQRVHAGEVLARLDPSDARIALAQAAANYQQTRRQVEQTIASEAAADATINARKADLVRAQEDYDRRAGLGKTGAVSGDELTAARQGLDSARANLVTAERQRGALAALIGNTDVGHNPLVLGARAAVEKAQLDLDRTVIRAPIDGVVAEKQIQLGEHVQVGAKLMSVVPLADVYVDANFKESQLSRVRAGQSAELTSDLYGSGVVFHGHVAGVSGGTGAAFAVIPAQNATGNWIKVVQRLPVRIRLDPKELEAHPLRVGLSVNVAIDLAKQSGQ